MLDRGKTELPVRRRSHLSAERVRHQLHPVADAEHGHAGGEHAEIAMRRARLRDALRTAGQDDADRRPSPQFFERRVERENFGIDRQFPQAPRDELSELRAEVEDDDGLMGHGESAIIRCASRGHHHIL